MQDTNGLALASNSTFYFQTGPAADTAQPRVTSITPPPSSSNIGTNAPVELHFSKPIDPLLISPSAVQITANGNPVTPVSINFVGSTNQDVQFVPIGALPANATINIAVSGLTDLSNNTIVPYTASFVTSAGPDLASPTIVTTNPYSGASNVPINSNITFQFNKPIDPSTINGNGGNFQILDNVTGQQLSGAYSTSSNSMQAIFTPSVNLAVGRTYSVYTGSGIHDLAGNLLGSDYLQFSTAFQTITSAPQITLSSPSNGQTAFPINGSLEVLFNEPVQSTSIADITLSAAGSVVPGVVNGLSNGNTLLTVTPPALLQGDTVYSLSIAGVLDLAGNALNPSVTDTFTTASGADLIGPTVTGLIPPSGATGIGTNVTPSATFSKSLNPISFDSSTIYLVNQNTGQYLPGIIIAGLGNESVSFKPSSSLTPTTQYCFYAEGVTDLVGYATYSDSCFTTGLGPDTIPPVISQMSPPNGTTGVAVNALLQFVASKQVNPSTFSNASVILMSGGTHVPANAVLGTDYETITVTPVTALSTSTVYTVSLGGFEDFLGNSVANFNASFTTSSSSLPDLVQPIVLSTNPLNGSTGVSATTPVTITFSEPVDPITVNGSTVSVYLQASGASLAGTFATNGSTVTFTPQSPIPGNSAVQVTIDNVLDYSANANQYYSFSFTTGAAADAIPPQVTSVTPPNKSTNLGLNTSVTLVFSESLDPSTINTANFALFNGQQLLSAYLSHSQDLTTVTLSAGTLPTNANIIVVVTNGVQDLSGNALAGFQSQFTTLPMITSGQASVTMQRPGNGATGVPLNAPFTLFFNHPMDPSTTLAAFNASQNGTLIAGTAALDASGQILTFTPTAPLVGGALVQVFEGTSALDTSGNGLYAFSGSFVAAPNLSGVPPVVTGTIPGNSSTVVINPVIEIQYSKPLDPTTINSTNVNLYLSQNNQVVPATISLRAGNTIRIVPANALLPNFGYYYYVSAGVKDTTGLSPATYYQQYFTTGSLSNSTQPRIDATTPPSGSVNVGVNAPVYFHFTEPINPLTISVGIGGSLQFTAGGNQIAPASISLASTQDITITPYATFPENTTISVSVSGVQDPSGNSLVPFTSSFTTAAGPHLSSANVTSASPVDGAIGIPLNSILTLVTDATIDPSTINSNSFTLYDNAGGAPLPGTYSLSPAGNVVTFAPSSPLIGSHSYRFYWNSSMQDITGNPLNGGSSGFTASSSAATAPLAVLDTNPLVAFTSVPTNVVPSILFSSPVQPSTLSGVTLSTGGTPLAITPSLSNGDLTLSLTPPTLLQSGTVYTLNVSGVLDVASNALATPVNFAFTTGSGPALVGPSLVSSIPVANATGVLTTTAPTLVFSTPLNPLSVVPSNIYIYNSQTGATVAANTTLSADGLTITITPSATLSTNTSYLIYGYGLTDLANNAVNYFNYAFATGGM